MPVGDPRRLRALTRRERRRLLALTAGRATLIVVVVVTAYYLLPFDRLTGVELAITMILALLLVGGIVIWQIVAVARSSLPQVRALEAIVAIVVLLIAVFAATYLGMSRDDPASFSEQLDHTGALYFTMTTLATVGFGDISARTNTARIAVMVQLVVNVAILGAAVRVLAGVARSRLRGDSHE